MKILFVGFSVTEEKFGYVNELKKIVGGWENINITIESAAIGGISFDFIPYLFTNLVKDKYDFIIYEIATCRRFCEQTDGYVTLLGEICDLTIKSGAVPCFLNLYRTGVDYNDDILDVSVEYYAKNNHYPFLGLSRSLLSVDFEGKYLRDGIHTNIDGARFYAQEIAKFIEMKLLSCHRVVSKNIIPLSRLIDGQKSGVFERGGVEMSYVEIPSGERLEIVFKRPTCISGLMFIHGPDSGFLKVYIPELGFSRKVHMFDQHCYYYRYGVHNLPNLMTNRVILEQLDDAPEITLNKGEYNGKSRVAQVVGFFSLK